MKFKGMGYKTEKSGKYEVIEYDPGQLKPKQVQVKIQYCGLCFSDVGVATNLYGGTQYPVITGHEGVGVIEEIGSAVDSRHVGQVVGIGASAGYCLNCPRCLSGRHILCDKVELIMAGRHGAMADRVRVDALAAMPIPVGMDPRHAAPLMCAGITVFNPMMIYDLKPTDSLGVIGVGGLGHVALQFGRAWGCHVGAFTTSAAKEEFCKTLGAHECIVTNDAEQMKGAERKFDMILNTTNAHDLDWGAYIKCLKPDGKLVMLGVIPEAKVPVLPMIFSQLSVCSSHIGPPDNVRKMLEFAMRHNIKPIVEDFKLSDINSAVEKLVSNKMRFRAVLEQDL